MSTFTHDPRPAHVPTGYEEQRYYTGKSSCLDIEGVMCTSAKVFRWSCINSAEIHVRTPHGNLHAELKPDALRELARCLIDAAADIEEDTK